MIERKPGKLPDKANMPPQHLVGLPKAPNGPSALDMLTSPVEGGPQDDPKLSEAFWYASAGLLGPEEPLDTNPDQEGPPGAAREEAEPGK